MIASISNSIGSSAPSLRPDQQASQRVLDAGNGGRAPEETAEERIVGGRIAGSDSGLGTEARRGLIASGGDAPAPGADGELTDAEKDVIDKLRARDVEVRRHEEAHARVGGQYAGQPSYTYQTGPDGNRYAIGGEVPIDVAPVPDDPEATIEKMRVVKAAALAPAEPSGADRRVAALADAQRLQAQADLSTEQREAALEAFEGASSEQGQGERFGSGDTGQTDRLLKGLQALVPDSGRDALDRAA